MVVVLCGGNGVVRMLEDNLLFCFMAGLELEPLGRNVGSGKDFHILALDLPSARLL